MRGREHPVDAQEGLSPVCHLLTLRCGGAPCARLRGVPGGGLTRVSSTSRGTPSDVSPAGERQPESGWGAVEEFCTAETRFHGGLARLGEHGRPSSPQSFLAVGATSPPRQAGSPARPRADLSKF